ncbi:hypothetical protein ADK38_30540 [Streptomyces varsoviensis]|uniref:Uncharacterized protein n=1 Tax=Streptomyces varsoviensis TaxID=67373 RepID=A0ABR5IZD3_9ACTN|nr:hypothetical protein ADK38_30540 [Streptomyces varsoviensis]
MSGGGAGARDADRKERRRGARRRDAPQSGGGPRPYYIRHPVRPHFLDSSVTNGRRRPAGCRRRCRHRCSVSGGVGAPRKSISGVEPRRQHEFPAVLSRSVCVRKGQRAARAREFPRSGRCRAGDTARA